MSLLISSFKETESLARKVAENLKVPTTKIIEKKFPDEETYLKLSANPKGKIFVIFNSFAREQNDRLIESILAAGIGKDFKAKKVMLVAPYFPYLRQDTHFENYDSFSIKYISHLINIFDKVYAFDPHLQRIKNIKQISKNMNKLSAVELIADYIKNNIKGDYSIVGPDDESKQWVGKVGKILKKKVIVLNKQRFSWHKVKIQNKPLGEKVIIIDDIIGTGNTIIETIKIAKKHGAKKIIVIGIHGVLVEGAAEKITKHAELITTNTIQNKYAKIDISPIIEKELKKYI